MVLRLLGYIHMSLVIERNGIIETLIGFAAGLPFRRKVQAQVLGLA